MPANTGSDGWGPSIFQMTVNICALVTQALGRVTLGKASGGRDEQAALGLAGVPLPLPSPPLPSLGASGTSVPARAGAGGKCGARGAACRALRQKPAPSSLYVGPVISTALAPGGRLGVMDSGGRQAGVLLVLLMERRSSGSEWPPSMPWPWVSEAELLLGVRLSL